MADAYNSDAYNSARKNLQEAFFDSSNYDWNMNHVIPVAQQQLQGGEQNFESQFQNLVGRAPTAEEINKFYGYVSTNPTQFGSSYSQGTTNSVLKDFINSNFQQAAQTQAMSDMQKQQGEASRLAELSRTQGNQAISSVESGLQDYQQRLFEKLRPQLLTSLQSQGLLNTGGLNEAFAGQAKDLADQTNNYLLQQKLANEQQANAIEFGGQSAPYNYNMATIQQRVPYMQQQGQVGLDQVFQNAMQKNQLQNQLQLIKAQTQAQESLQPSFFRTFSQGLGNSMGSNFGSWFQPPKMGA